MADRSAVVPDTRVPSRQAVVFATVLAVLLALVPGALMSSAQAFTPPPTTDIQFKLKGCRFYDGLTLPTDFGSTIGTKYACPDNGDYTDGNLGKGWNELDLVPFQMESKNSANGARTFNVIIAVDSLISGTTGYDYISVPEIFRDSAAGCTVTAAAMKETSGITGGTDKSLYRVLTVTVPAKSTCQLEWYSRLGMGSHGVPGSSLQAYMFESEDFQIGKRTVPIPVGEKVMSLSKDMAASRASDHMWTVEKKPSPASISLNTCTAQTDTVEVPLSVTVTWTRKPATPGVVTIQTTVYAANPLARPLAVNVEDKIYAGSGQTQMLDTASATNVTVPANTANVAVLIHTYEWKNAPADATTVNDVATAQIVDNVTKVPVPGTLQAAESATIQDAPATNKKATITDSQSLTGPAGVEFSSATTSIGAYEGYTAGSKTIGPVNWTSGQQNGSGSVEFPQTVFFPKGTSGTGELKDTATVTGSDGFTTSADAKVDLDIDTLATLTIRKAIPDILTGEETATFTFDVKDAEGSIVADDVPVSFTAGQTSNTADVPGLAPGVYTVVENPAAGWDAPGDPVPVDLSGTTCAGTAPFENTITQATATAIKRTDPLGNAGGWVMTLTRDGSGQVGQVTTDDNGTADFGSIPEGSYTITETMQDGWSFVDSSGDCQFTVDYPRDAGKAFTCTLTNRLNPVPPAPGSVRITKEFNPLSSGFTGAFTIDYSCINGAETVKSGSAALRDGESTTVDGLPVGTVCTVTEPNLPTPPSGWQFNTPTFDPASGQATVTQAEQTVEVRVINSITAVNPERVKQACPITPTLTTPKVTKVGSRVLIKKVKTNKACVIVKPVVLCRPVANAAAGQTAFCRTTVTRKGFVKVKTKGYGQVRVTVLVRAKPKPANTAEWKAKTWRKSWLLT